MERPDQGLYWQARYLADDGIAWKVDNWLLSVGDPHSEWENRFIQAFERAVTLETRCAILKIKVETIGQEWA